MSSRVSRLAAHLIFGSLLLLSAAAQVHAQTPSSLTPEQLQIFQSLTPEQQRAALDALSKSSGEGGTTPPELTPTPEPQSRPRPQGTSGEQRTRGEQPSSATEEGVTGAALREPRIGPRSTLLIGVEAKPIPAAQAGGVDAEKEAAIRRERRERILAGNPFKLNGSGQVVLPSLPPITLQGLTAAQAGQRLNADPHLVGLKFTVSLLPVAPEGAEALKPFGYELFTSEQSSFAPATNIPVPTDYILGPGDTVLIELFGKKVGHYSLVVDRDGELHLPDLAPIGVAGLSFDRVKDTIEQLIAERMIGVRASVTMGALRTIRVFVAGDVNRPSSYVVSGLSTVTNALFAAGGVSEIGSLRNVEIKRRGVIVGRLDLYALLLSGNNSGDLRLEPGDVVFVPPVGATVGIAGEVRRPAVYEVREGNTVADLIALAGGLVPEADLRAAKLERIDSSEQRVVIDVDLSRSSALTAMRLKTGDVLTVPRVLDEMARTVTLEGEVLRPGKYAWHDNMHLTELLSGLNALKEDADQRYILIRREHYPDRRISVVSTDAVQAFQEPGSVADPLLQSRDRVIVFPLQKDRGDALGEVLEALRAQARDETAPPVVSVDGHTAAPGDYPLEPGMRVSDLIRAGGGLDAGAYALDAELTRFEVTGGESRRTEVLPVNLAAVLRKDAAADLQLRPYDTLTVKELPEWSTQGAVTLRGEVRFPGRYPISKGETLSSVIKRAGGLTPYAFPQGAVFTREEIKEQEREQIDRLVQRMQADLSTFALQSAQVPTAQGSNAAQALSIGQSLLAQLKSTQPVGRLVINVRRAVEHPGNTENDVQLRPGDRLAVPRLRQYVTVIGEIQNPTSHIWKHALNMSDYIEMSGGTTPNADRGRIYVVRADGSVAPKVAQRWFRPENEEIRTGDTIVVPLDTQKVPRLQMWQAVTTILYNIAIAVAAVHAL